MASATLIGLGNIGSALAQLVARMPGISALTLVDPDVYSESNLSTQAIDGAASGKPKVTVQAALISAINPQISVEPIQDRVENVPLAVLRSSVLISCVDNRRARQTINRISWRCGSPWIDAAVDAPSLVRVNTSMPGESACIECGWTEISYELLEQDYACNVGSEISVPATAAPAELGTLAASLQAAELRKLLSGATNGASLVGAQVMLDTATHMTHLSRFERNEHCRFDHERWEIETAFDELKTHLRGGRIVLRSKTPELVAQEFYGLMMAHFAIRGLMHEAALKADLDPDRLSFIHTVRVVRRKLPTFAAIPPSALVHAP